MTDPKHPHAAAFPDAPAYDRLRYDIEDQVNEMLNTLVDHAGEAERIRLLDMLRAQCESIIVAQHPTKDAALAAAAVFAEEFGRSIIEHFDANGEVG